MTPQRTSAGAAAADQLGGEPRTGRVAAGAGEEALSVSAFDRVLAPRQTAVSSGGRPLPGGRWGNAGAPDDLSTTLDWRD